MMKEKIEKWKIKCLLEPVYQMQAQPLQLPKIKIDNVTRHKHLVKIMLTHLQSQLLQLTTIRLVNLDPRVACNYNKLSLWELIGQRAKLDSQ